MKTRFDGKLWIGAFGLALEVKDMETAHLLNTVKMLVQKPARVQAMLVTDIEDATFEEQEAWTPNGSGEDIRKKSLHNATSLTSEELVQYVTGTPLFKAMMEELEDRGVNTENIMELYTKDAAFSAYARLLKDMHFVMAGGDPCKVCAKVCMMGEGNCQPEWTGEKTED